MQYYATSKAFEFTVKHFKYSFLFCYKCWFCPPLPVFAFLFAYSETMSGEQRLLSIPELSHHLAESYLTCCLYLQEMLQYKRQNHGKVWHFDSGWYMGIMNIVSLKTVSDSP